MKIAYLDCFSGISGDMFLGALIDAGVPPNVFEETVAVLQVGATLEISRVNRSAISATKLDVIVDGKKDAPREVHARESHDHAHPHDHHHDVHHHQHPHSRGLVEIRELIRKSKISESAKNTAIAIFEKLGEAESGFTISRSSKFIFMKSVRLMLWLILFARRSVPKRWALMNLFVRH
jgi:hypothetical protein